MRAVSTVQIDLDTSIGRVSGELWSDNLCGLHSPVADADRRVAAVDDLVGLLSELGVPAAEAQQVAAEVWNQAIAPQRRAWAAERR